LTSIDYLPFPTPLYTFLLLPFKLTTRKYRNAAEDGQCQPMYGIKRDPGAEQHHHPVLQRFTPDLHEFLVDLYELVAPKRCFHLRNEPAIAFLNKFRIAMS